MPFLVKEKGSKSSKIRKLTRKFILPPFWTFLKFQKSTMEVVDMLVRFLGTITCYDSVRLGHALFSKRKRVKNE